MKSLTSAMIGYLQSDTQTLNTCWEITRTDGSTFYFTDCDQPIAFGGNTYKSVDGYSPSTAQSSSTFDVDHVEVTSWFDSASVTEADLMAGKWDDAVVSMFMVNRNDLTAGAYHIRDGVIGQVTVTAPGQFQVELRGLNQYLQKQLGTLLTPTCRWTFCDQNAQGTVSGSHCTLSLSSFAVTGVAVTGVTSNQQFAASSLAQPAGYFTAGFLTWTSGANNGRSMDIQGSGTGGAIVLQLPMLNTVTIGDTFTIYAGCQKRYNTDCIAKFSNGINFGGFPYVPGIDKMVRPGGV